MSEESLRDARKTVGNRGEIKITNHEAYKIFLELSADPVLNADKYITVSDGRTLSLGYPRIMTSVKDLPQKEQDQIAVRKKIYDKKHGTRNAMYSKAFGAVLRHDGLKSKVDGRVSPLLQRKEELIELFGRMFTLKEVHEVCLKDWDLRVSLKVLDNFRDANKHIIAQKIEDYKRSYDTVRLCHKRSRLEELTWLYNKRKAIHQTTGKSDDHKLLLSTLEQLRKEAEGDTLRIDGNMNINMELTIKNQIENDLMKHILVKEIIISRVCAKLGTDPVKMLTSIKESFYKSRLEAPDDIAHEEIKYPSDQAYDFNRIEAINRQLEQKQEIDKVKYEESKVVPIFELSGAEAIKKKLIDKLKGKKEAVNKIKNSAFFSNLKKDENE